MHLAVEKGYYIIIKLLLKNKDINIHIKDDKGRQPVDCGENYDIKQLLYNFWFGFIKNDFFFLAFSHIITLRF